MGTQWLEQLQYNPIEGLLTGKQDVVSYFVHRDLLDEPVPEIEWVWEQPDVQRILQKQLPNGSWKYPGKKKLVYPSHHHALVETWKQFRILVRQYELTRDHLVGQRAAEFLFSCQTSEGDIRGMIGNQYATYYTGAMLGLLIRAGYGMDPRVEHGLQWLLSMRQDDGGWTIPILTQNISRETSYQLTTQKMDPVKPDRSQPFSHNWTDMVLRAFAVHPHYRTVDVVRVAADLLKTRFFQPDVYSSYQAASYWIRFGSWWPNLLTSMESLSLMGYSDQDPSIRKAINWFVQHQQPNGLWNVTYVEGKTPPRTERTRVAQLWISLSICRILKRILA